MADLIQKAITANRESRTIEFKSGFDPTSASEWCELIKDVVALANSGGGILIFGLDNFGNPLQTDLTKISAIDPADIENKVAKYIGSATLELDVCEVEKLGSSFPAWMIHGAEYPVVFEKPGTYELSPGKQKTAFSAGTVYFRKGAKSAPGTTEDIRKACERQIERVRKAWVNRVRKVVDAPAGTQFVALKPAKNPTQPGSLLSSIPTSVRSVKDSLAIPVFLTRDPTAAGTLLVHEQISDGIFDEINNVIDANRILSKGNRHFAFDTAVYYRIYSERNNVHQNSADLELLFQSGAIGLYAPGIYWTLELSNSQIAAALANVYLHPTNPQIQFLIRFAVLLGKDFCGWLLERMHQKWKRHSQPPLFYWSFQDLIKHAERLDTRLVASRSSYASRFEIPGEAPVSVSDCLKDQKRASDLLSKACWQVFSGTPSFKSHARSLDFLTYGAEIVQRKEPIGTCLIQLIGKRGIGDPKTTLDEE